MMLEDRVFEEWEILLVAITDPLIEEELLISREIKVALGRQLKLLNLLVLMLFRIIIEVEIKLFQELVHLQLIIVGQLHVVDKLADQGHIVVVVIVIKLLKASSLVEKVSIVLSGIHQFLELPLVQIGETVLLVVFVILQFETFFVGRTSFKLRSKSLKYSLIKIETGVVS